MVKLEEVLEVLNSLCEDKTLSKNMRACLAEIKKELETGENVDVKIDAALQKVENLSSDPNLAPYARAQIWDLTSMLEAANSK